MAEARQRAAWAVASSIMALIANVNRDPKKSRAFKPDDFNPFVSARKARMGLPLTRENLHRLKGLFQR